VVDVELTNIERSEHMLTRIIQGIKKGQSKPPFAMAGGHRTYRLGYHETYKLLQLHLTRLDDNGWGGVSVVV
jgi:hypothetical protein